jgi:hypothetical protein
MISRRRLLVGGALGASALGASALATQTAAAASSPDILLKDTTVRLHGPVMFIGDSVSSLLWRSLRRDSAKAGLGPFRLDLQPGRSISRSPFGWGRNAVKAVAAARSDGFDPPTYVVALGWVDILPRHGNPAPIRTAQDAATVIEPLLQEIGIDRTVGFFNVRGFSWARYTAFNDGLALLTETWPNVYVIDWASYAKGHLNWHRPDGYHMNYVGAPKRQRFVVRSMVDACIRTSQRLTPPPP